MFTPLLSTHDWNEEWKQLQLSRRAADDENYWDKRAKSFSSVGGDNPYAQQFLALAKINPGETVFDMGCGTGALSIPLAKAGHCVIASDFSQGMLNELEKGLAAQGVQTENGSVSSLKMSWEDNWADFGISSNHADIALASRSIATSNLRDSLLRLTDVAKRRVCITLATGYSPRIDGRMVEDLGLSRLRECDALYAFNILVNEGILPEVSYIESPREHTFESIEEALSVYWGMVEAVCALPVSEAAQKSLRNDISDWLQARLEQNPDEGKPDRKGLPQKALRMTAPRITTWAFLAWNAR